MRSVSIPTSAGPLAGVIHLPARTPAPVVVCCHGLMSSKESTKFIAFGESFSHRGLAVLRFDFTGCGDSKTSYEPTLLSTRIRDLDAVIHYVQQQPWMDGRLGLLGSSLGGYLALLAASGKHSVRAVVCWATPFDLERIHRAVQETGMVDGRFTAGLRLGEPQRLEGLEAVDHLLVIHGQEDELVSWKDAVEIYRRAGEPKRLLLVNTAEHRFLDPAHRRLATQSSLDWFIEQGLDGSTKV